MVIAVAPPTIVGAAMLGAVPMGLSALAIGRFGIETHKRRLEEIADEEMAVS